VDDIYEAVRRLVEGRGRQKERGGPRSRIVDAIMVLLLAGPRRASEIASILGFETKYVSSYLSYWRTRGYVEYENGFWFLTPKGEEYAESVLERETSEDKDRMAAIARRILSSPDVKATRNYKTRGTPEGGGRGSLSFTVPLKGKGDNELQERAQRAKCILEALREDLDPEELEVLSHILSHYAKWGSTYIYVDNLAERMEADYNWLLRVARRLQSKGILYIYNDPRLGMRLGLTKNMKSALSSCDYS